MKPKSLTTLLLGIVASLCLSVACDKKEEPLIMPPETQIGVHTFGCYVNGELFVNFRRNTIHPLDIFAEYSRGSGDLMLFCRGQIGEMYLNIDNPISGACNPISLAKLELYSNPNFFFACEECDHVFITKFDTINNIASGTFEFSGRHAIFYQDGHVEYVDDSTVQVTSGRFDVTFQNRL